MALGDPYGTLDRLKSRLDIDLSDTTEDADLTDALEGSSRGVEGFCKRQFNKATTATARVYRPLTSSLAFVDDFHTTTDLVVEVDTTGDGTFDTTLTSADYQLEPLNGMVEGEGGWPFWRIALVGDSGTGFTVTRRATLRVTAQWGWDEIPASVTEGALLLAEETFKLKDAPFGVAGFGEFGPLRVRDNPKVASMLAKYRRKVVRVAS